MLKTSPDAFAVQQKKPPQTTSIKVACGG